MRFQTKAARVAVGVAAALGLAATSVLTTIPAQAAPVVPSFDPITGASLAVFTDRSAWLYDQAWVVVPEVDTDRDGLDDLVHVDVVRQGETAGGLRVPVILSASPYFAGSSNVANHDIYVEVGEDPDYAADPPYSFPNAATTSTLKAGTGTNVGFSYYISNTLVADWVSRGFAVGHAELSGSGFSEGCPTVGDADEQAFVKAAVEWFAHKDGMIGYTDLTRSVRVSNASNPVTWSTGKVGMTGTS